MKVMLPRSIYSKVAQHSNRFNASLVISAMRSNQYFDASSLEFESPMFTRVSSNILQVCGLVLVFILVMGGIVYKVNTAISDQDKNVEVYEMVDTDRDYSAAYNEQNSPARIKTKHQHRSVSVFEELEEDV